MKIFSKLTYLDNAATTHKKPLAVKRAIKHAIKINANPGRGGHSLSIEAGRQVFVARQVLNEYFNGYGEQNIFFVENCTDGLNLAILGSLNEGDHVVASMHEHNSVLRPLAYLKENKGVQISIIKPKNAHKTSVSDIEAYLQPNTKMVVISHVSNVIGAVADIENIGKLCAEKNIIFVVDAAQSAGHMSIDMKLCHIDYLAIASHKGIFGVAGASALLSSGKHKLNPIRFGGTGTNSQSLLHNFEAPEVYESGTKSLLSIMAMTAGIRYVQKNKHKISKKIEKLSKQIADGMPKNTIVYSKNNNGLVLFNVKDMSPTTVASFLNDKKIAVRSGLQCAPLAHRMIGTGQEGAVRASVSYFNTNKDIKKFLRELGKLQ